MKQMVTSLFGMFGSAVALLFGGWDIALQTLVLFMGIDWITGGILLPVIFKKSPKSENGRLESRAGWKGLCRKGMTLLFVLIAVWECSCTFIWRMGYRTADIGSFYGNRLDHRRDSSAGDF